MCDFYQRFTGRLGVRSIVNKDWCNSLFINDYFLFYFFAILKKWSACGSLEGFSVFTRAEDFWWKYDGGLMSSWVMRHTEWSCKQEDRKLRRKVQYTGKRWVPSAGWGGWGGVGVTERKGWTKGRGRDLRARQGFRWRRTCRLQEVGSRSGV